MRLLRRQRRRSEPRAKAARPAAEPYLAAGAAEARRLGHNYVGTEHVLLVLVRDRAGGARTVLQQLDVTADAVEQALSPCIGGGAPKIDPDALATLGIDFEAGASGSRRRSGRARSSTLALPVSALRQG
jgi:ATP-dependent Clp protease ATP-binding subunit ClpC